MDRVGPVGLQAREASKAMAEYEAASRAMIEKTAKLRSLRLAREAAEALVVGVGAGGRKISHLQIARGSTDEVRAVIRRLVEAGALEEESARKASILARTIANNQPEEHLSRRLDRPEQERAYGCL